MLIFYGQVLGGFQYLSAAECGCIITVPPEFKKSLQNYDLENLSLETVK